MQQTGRSTSSGNASAVFVVSAAQLEMRNNLFAYTNADLLGSAFLLNDQTLVGSFVADTNWYASPDPNQLRVAWNGARVTWAKWLTLSGQDAAQHRIGAAHLHGRGRRGIRQSRRCEGNHARSRARSGRHTAARAGAARHERLPARLTLTMHNRGQARDTACLTPMSSDLVLG